MDTAPADGWWVVSREWNEGDEVVMVLPLEPRFTAADPRLDATRGAVAIEYGPLVYCLEAIDNRGNRLDDLTIDTTVAPKLLPADGTLGAPRGFGPRAVSGLGSAPHGGLTVLWARRRETNPGSRSR